MQIIYEDSDIIAVNKPAGVSVHPDRHHPSDTLIQMIAGQFPEIEGVGEDPLRPGVVHRLDKDTSGVLVVARNQEAFDYLKKQFHMRTVVKEYAALVVGKVKEKKGTIDMPIGRSKNDPTRRAAEGLMRGMVREARTDYEVIEYFGGGYTLVRLFPKTGRTHQIRVHMKAIGYPIVCDKLYAGKRFVCPFGLNRHFLHASTLEIALPQSGKIRLEADIPVDLERVLEGLRNA
ncbi:MAG: RluA family pseudouridine synthase [Candidatus Niyogibacteria bacterium CG10_big_fil_rev_8_21_14_0_10_46_36]|uniref:Pseudouridine synthase n=1 Tax=Candidatus Niyogibacteria bacterium CG10_big_fil_rev_8_21_14_0_10_46_36 TaxID=1974726 RepID=A0A2H0TCG4_9BACT|nr:MAG: RluA family pseudouridine synthase [Candidatus Niyogibacteria bacterium CG10_big_fil_rev_8_21_14_0_10_46_36]